ncbi:hypothetical protein BT67DRAFT_220327 [Trichocladium antarcticum]|uniref:Uncharacterized protein n=1 Tax=Trichocladium antarcticum TaxID=1450529 RepID=A0AAN6UCH8_9PEZI|nr:hypothetical protein BT67DRAFT_220327 [Trichocladium antarcticum]
MTGSRTLAHFRIFAHLIAGHAWRPSDLSKRGRSLAAGKCCSHWGDGKGARRCAYWCQSHCVQPLGTSLCSERNTNMNPTHHCRQVGGIWEGGIGDMGSRSGHTLHAGREAAAGVGARRAIKQAAHACRSRRRRLLIGTGVSPSAGHMERGTREASSNCA